MSKKNKKRTLVIGDVHGCSRELDDLIEKLEYNPKSDELIFIGDLINKGPDSKGVFERYQSWNAKAILGNHEQIGRAHV